MMERLSESQKDALLVALGQPNGTAQLADLRNEAGLDHDEAIEVSRELRGLGLAQSDVSPVEETALTTRGTRVAGMVRDSRQSGPDRADTVQGAFLAWLTEQPQPAAGPLAFLNSRQADAAAAPFSEDEAYEAVDYLESKGLVESLGSRRADGRLNVVRVTPEGRAALRSGQPVSRYLSQGQGSHVDNRFSNTFNNSPLHGSAVQTGIGNQQEVHIAWRQREEFVAAVDRVLEQVQDDPLRGELLELRDTAAQPDASQGTVRDMFIRVLATAGRVAVKALPAVAALAPFLMG